MANAKLSIDTPKFIMDMLSAVDYARITDAHYIYWTQIIKENIGKHLKKKVKASPLVDVPYPIRQDFCDLINEYDFQSLNLLKQKIAVPLAIKWANENLPLRRKL